MGMPVKLSDDLVEAARKAASADDRSITGQIEHWARLGRAVEATLHQGAVRALKQAGAPAPLDERRLIDTLQAVVRSSDRASVLARIRAGGRPVYESVPGEPGVLVQVAPDGTRTRGRLIERRFVPLQADAPGP